MENLKCTGCSACVNICPHSCITMKEDNEGFLYPCRDMETCINCGLCENVCPVNLNNSTQNNPLSIFACRVNAENNLINSSSGGMFGMIATDFIKSHGVVVAARFDENNKVVHDVITTVAQIESYKRSKYSQSDLGFVFKEIRKIIKAGTKVLFVGTPCQVAGLLAFLRKPYDKLYCIDFVCHGVPSPGVWKEYLKTLGMGISNINFRDKETGWPNYSFSYVKEGVKHRQIASQNPYMRGFLHDLYLRPSCYECKFKGFNSGSDVTMSDFWGVWKNFPKWNDQKGAGILAINSSKGQLLLDMLDKNMYEHVDVTIQQAYIDYNSSAYHCASYNPKRDIFFSRFKKEALVPLIVELSKDSLVVRIKNTLSRMKHKII